MLPQDHVWPIDSWWEYHAGGMSQTLSIFTEALNKRYGASASAEEYSRKAQMQAYEGHRAMMEAYGRVLPELGSHRQSLQPRHD